MLALAALLLLGTAVTARAAQPEEIQRKIDALQDEVMRAQQQLLALLDTGTTASDDGAQRAAQALGHQVSSRLAELDKLKQTLVDAREEQSQRAGQAEVDRLNEALAASRAQTDELNRQLAAMERESEAPAANATLRIFRLKFVDAQEAALTVSEVVGRQGVRTAVDVRTNALIVSTSPDKLEAISALLTNLDEKADQAATPSGVDKRSLLVRVIWLADDLADGEGDPPADYLPIPVIEALDKLGVAAGRVVGQAIASVSPEGENGRSVTFRSRAEALIREEPVALTCEGEVRPIVDNRAAMNVDINVSSPTVNTAVEGSISTPLGQYMVLGTANTVSAGSRQDVQTDRERQKAAQREERGRGGSGDADVASAGKDSPAYRASRFVFVVQVLEAESFAPESTK